MGVAARIQASRSCSAVESHEQVGGEAEEALLDARRTGIGPTRLRAQTVEDRRHVLERLALEESCEQLVALLPQRQLLVEIEVVAPGEQTTCLQLDERRGDEEELGGDVEIELLGVGGDAIELGEVGVDDAAERHLVQVDLLADDEVQEEVERALEDRGLHLVGHLSRLAAGVTPT